MRKHETAVCGTARTVVWEVGKCENRRQMPFIISIYLLPDFYKLYNKLEYIILEVCSILYFRAAPSLVAAIRRTIQLHL